MVQNSGPLVSGVVEALQAAHESRDAANDAMRKTLGAMKKINATVSATTQKHNPPPQNEF